MLQGTPTPHSLSKIAATVQNATHVLPDSEEGPLVLPRPHGPPHKRFADAHILPCSSPAEQDAADGHAVSLPDGDMAGEPGTDAPALRQTDVRLGPKPSGTAAEAKDQTSKASSSKRLAHI